MQIITLPRQSTHGQHIKKLSGKLGKELLTMAPSNPKFAQPSDLRRQALYLGRQCTLAGLGFKRTGCQNPQHIFMPVQGAGFVFSNIHLQNTSR